MRKEEEKQNLPKLVGGQFTELVELDLFREHVQRHRGRPSQPATALVIVQYGVERRPVSVEEVLVAQRIEVPHPPARIAQKSIRKLVQRPKLRLEPHTTHLIDRKYKSLKIRTTKFFSS